MKQVNKMKKLNANSIRSIRKLGYMAMLYVATLPAFAGSTSSGLDANVWSEVVELLKGWLQGGLGLIISLISLIAALIMGIRGNIWLCLTTFAIAVLAYFGPNILQNMFSATLQYPIVASAIIR